MSRTLQPESRISHYRIVGPLGTGGMGEVYLAKDESLERNVALKVLPPELMRSEDRVRRFMLEARSASSLNHPHIVTIYEVGRDVVRGADGSEDAAVQGEVHYIAMELISGKTLKDLIHNEQAELRTLVGYLAQAAEGLSKAHGAGIVHRDLKPGNIMVTADGYAKVLDFGLAKLTEKTAPSQDRSSAPTELADRTTDGALLGTVGYMSPEQVRGKAVDHRSDVFSFGCILYEAATRQRPFAGESDIDTMHGIVHDNPPPVDQFDPMAPAELRRVIRRCLAKSPEQRLQSMKDLAIELREIADEYDTLSASATSASMVGTVSMPGKRRRVPGARIAAWAGALVAGMALALLALQWWPTGGGGAAAARPFQSIRMNSLLSVPAMQEAVMSPDGRYLAYIAGIPGSQRLRVRQIATGSDLDVLPASEFVRSPAFSPDGSYILYLQRDPDAPNYSALFDIPSLGGTPRKRIFDVDSGVSFDPEGRRIVFARGVPQNQTTAIIIADIGTGEEKTLATVTRPETLSPFVRPAWSPDGKRIVSALQQEGGTIYAGLAAFDASTGAREQLRIDGARMVFIDSVAWLPDGKGLVVTGAALDTLTPQVRYIGYPGGASRRITSDLTQYASVSVDRVGGSLAALRTTGSGDLWVAPMDGSAPARQVTFEASKDIGDIVILDGGMVAFTANDDAYRRLMTVRDDGSQLRPITSGSNYAVGPAFPYKKDGMAFTLYSGNPIVGHVSRVDKDGGNLTRLTDGTGEHLGAISPDGSTVLYTNVGSQNDVWSVSSGSEPKKLLEGVQGNVRFSLDGKLILYPTFKMKDGLIRTAFVVVPAAGGAPIAEVIIEGISFGVDWAPDGSLTYGRTIQNVGNVWRHPIPNGGPVQVTHFSEGRLERFQWSRDGKRILVVRRLGLQPLVQSVSSDGNDVKTLIDLRTGNVDSIHVSDDHARAYFVQGEQRTDVVQIRDSGEETGGP